MEDLAPPPYSEHDPHPRDNHAPPTAPSRPNPPRQLHDADPPFVSGAAYFAMRAPPSCQQGKLISAVLTLLPGSLAADITLPRVIQKSRKDVEYGDWEAFLNHLIPSRNPQHQRSAQARSENKGTITVSPAPAETPILPNKSHLKRVIEEWNYGFFLPRGISLVLQTPLPSSTPPPVKRTGAQMGQALYEAVKAQDIPTAQLLLSHGADTDWKPSCGTPQIVYAVKKNNVKLLQLLLERGPNLEDSAPGDGTSLYYAIKNKSVEMTQMLLLYGASVDNAHPGGGDPALYYAVKNNSMEIVQLLLTQPEVDLEKKPPAGATCVYRAAKEENLEMVQLLLAHGAKAECKEPGGASAMHKAAKRGDVAMTRTLLEAGAKVDSTARGGNTALYEATKNRDMAMVGLLLEYGADVNKKSCGNKSALAWARKNRETELVRKLLGDVSEA